MITHDYKLIFIHIPKCAGRSVSEIFNQRFDQYTANFYRTEYGRFWNEYDKFTIVRNPLSRYVSMYEYIMNHRRHKNEPIALCPDNSKPDFKKWLQLNIMNYQGHFNLNSPEGQRGTDYMLGSSHWFSPQIRTLQDNDGNIDDIKIFRMEDGLETVESYMRSKGVINAKLPHLNKSEHRPWQEYYDVETANLAYSFESTRIDFEALNYEPVIDLLCTTA